MTRKFTNKNLLTEIRSVLCQKTSTKLGAKPGMKANIWIEDLNLPLQNHYQVREPEELLRLIYTNNCWYNYDTGLK